MEGVLAPTPPPVAPAVPEDAVRIAARLRAAVGRGKVIAFTSGAGGEGATAVAAAVAAALAQMDVGAVLLVDANFPAPSCHPRFGLPRGPGLADVLQGAASFDQAVRPTVVGRLSVMPIGTPVAPAATLRTLATLGAVTARAREHHDFVLVEAPGFVRSAVASVILAQADAVVLVVGAGAHRRRELVEMRRELESLNAPLLGVVLSGDFDDR